VGGEQIPHPSLLEFVMCLSAGFAISVMHSFRCMRHIYVSWRIHASVQGRVSWHVRASAHASAGWRVQAQGNVPASRSGREDQRGWQ